MREIGLDFSGRRELFCPLISIVKLSLFLCHAGRAAPKCTKEDESVGMVSFRASYPRYFLICYVININLGCSTTSAAARPAGQPPAAVGRISIRQDNRLRVGVDRIHVIGFVWWHFWWSGSCASAAEPILRSSLSGDGTTGGSGHSLKLFHLAHAVEPSCGQANRWRPSAIALPRFVRCEETIARPAPKLADANHAEPQATLDGCPARWAGH